MELTPDFKEFVRLLNENEVRYLLVGGYAVAAYGYPRFTGDIDIWIDTERSNVEKILRILKEFGFGSLNIAVEYLMVEDVVIQLGYPPNRIDLLTGVSGLSFIECWEKKQVINISNEPLNVVSLDHLKINKKKTNRDRDKDDLEHLP